MLLEWGFLLWLVIFVKTTLLWVAAAIYACASKKAAPAMRHRMLATGILAALVIPLLHTMAPNWTLLVLPSTFDSSIPSEASSQPVTELPTETQASISVEGGDNALGAAGISELPQPDKYDIDSWSDEPASNTPSPTSITTPQTTHTIPNSTESGLDAFTPVSRVESLILPLLTLIYLMGFGLLAIRLLIGITTLSSWRRRAQIISDPGWDQALELAKADIGVKRPITLCHLPVIQTPMTWGILCPVIAIPRELFDQSSATDRRLILLHELAHIRRMDWLIQVLSILSCSMNWFNPLGWWMHRRMMLEAELACDQHVVTVDHQPGTYASFLAQLQHISLTPRRIPISIGIAMGGARSHLTRRLAMLGRKGFANPQRRTSLITTLLLGAMISLLGCIEITSAQQRPEHQAQRPLPKEQPGDADVIQPDEEAIVQNGLTQDQVDEAIHRLIAALYESQADDGGWYGAFHDGPDEPTSRNDWGPSSMALLALVTSGESPEKEAIQSGLKHLTGQEITGLYPLSMRTQLLSKVADDETMRRLLEIDTMTLLNSAHELSRFGYRVGLDPQPLIGRIDNSTTQYGVIGVWSAGQAGLKSPKNFWSDVIANFLETQQPDGGWSYSGNRNTTESMTVAGLTCLYLAQQNIARQNATPNRQIQDAIERGLAFLEDNYDPDQMVHSAWDYRSDYNWFGYARIGQLSGNWRFNQTDVYEDIASRIANDTRQFGNRIHAMAFRLMFLAESSQPVWINKLKIEDTAWNNRPNDVYFLNRYIGHYNRAALNWRVVDLNTSSKDWANAPVLWLSADDKIDWTNEQAENIKRYLDQGGTLIANPEHQGKHEAFRASIKQLAKKMYPDLTFEIMAEDHPLATRKERGLVVPRGVEVLNYKDRAIIVVPKQDWGRAIQSDENPGIRKHEAWYVLTNLFDQVNEAGLIKPRLYKP